MEPEMTVSNIKMSPGKSHGSNGGSIMIELEGLIKNHISGIAKVKEEKAKHREMLEDIFNNDPTYKEHTDKAKEALRIKKQTKAEILKRPDVAELNQKVKSFTKQAKEQQMSLFDYAAEYYRTTGIDEIEADDGTMNKIIMTAKVVRIRKILN